MSDITMCRGLTCDIRERCYRYTAVPHVFHQTWGDFSHEAGEWGCTYFKSKEFFMEVQDHEKGRDGVVPKRRR